MYNQIFHTGSTIGNIIRENIEGSFSEKFSPCSKATAIIAENKEKSIIVFLFGYRNCSLVFIF